MRKYKCKSTLIGPMWRRERGRWSRRLRAGEGGS